VYLLYAQQLFLVLVLICHIAGRNRKFGKQNVNFVLCDQFVAHLLHRMGYISTDVTVLQIYNEDVYPQEFLHHEFSVSDRIQGLYS
jgi:hypothetical protein